MTPDEHDPQLSAEDEERVRRALAASAPGPAATPHDVAARLDDVLARLVAERRDGVPAGLPASEGLETVASRPPRPPATDDELAARRRRRLGPRLLVAAASVAVLAVGSAVVVQIVRDSGGGAMSTAGVASEDAARPHAPAADSGADALTSSPHGAVPSPGATTFLRDQRGVELEMLPARLRRAALDQDLRRLARPDVQDRALAGLKDAPAAAAYPCELPAAGRRDRLVAVRLDGQRATLVLGPVHDGARAARVYACDDASTPVVERTVPAR